MTSFLTMVIHGESKAGKSWLGASAPPPILVIDAEGGGMRFVPGKKIKWDPLHEDPPSAPTKANPWEICSVTATSTLMLDTVRDFVKTGKHPFTSIVVDSLTEIQDRMKREISATGDLEERDWGRMLIRLEDLVMQFRDMTEAQEQLRAFVCIAYTRHRDNKFRPFMQGQIASKLGYKVDLTGYLRVTRDNEGNLRRGLQIAEDRDTEAGSRVGQFFDDAPVLWDPNITQILHTLEEGMNNDA